MSNDLNQCQFIGRLGKDPEIRYTSDGKPIANISIAVGESWKNKSTGQKQEKTNWVPIVIFGALAGIVGEYLKKGSKIYVSGKFQTRKWQDQSGQDKYTTEIVVDGFSGKMQMLDSNPAGQNNQQAQQPQQQNNYNQKAQQPQSPQTQNNGQQTQPDEDDLDSDLPFK